MIAIKQLILIIALQYTGIRLVDTDHFMELQNIMVSTGPYQQFSEQEPKDEIIMEHRSDVPAPTLPASMDEIIMEHRSDVPAPTLPASMSLLVGPTNTEAVCPYCKAGVKTTVKYTSTTRTHIVSALCSITCCFCCACLPFCWESTRNADHYCPNCNRYLGTYRK